MSKLAWSKPVLIPLALKGLPDLSPELLAVETRLRMEIFSAFAIPAKLFIPEPPFVSQRQRMFVSFGFIKLGLISWSFFLHRFPDALDNPEIRWAYQCYIWGFIFHAPQHFMAYLRGKKK